MADGVTLNAGTGGVTAATDDCGAAGHTQVVKLAISANGDATLIPGDAANGIDVDVTRVGGTVTVSGTVNANAGSNLNTSALALENGGNLDSIAVNASDILIAANLSAATAGSPGFNSVLATGVQGVNGGLPVDVTEASGSAIATSLAILDDWDESDRAKVNIIAGQVGVQGGSGTTNALTQRVVLATDVALPAGTNAIGKLAANSGVDIGDVDVTSVGTITPGTAATSLGKAEDGGHSSGDVGVMALGVRTDTPNAARADTDLDYAPVALYRTGAVRTAIPEEDFAALGSNHVKKYYTNSGAVTDGIVWSPAAGKRWYVTDLILNTSAAATVTLEDDKAGGDEAVMKFELAANSGVAHRFATPLFSGEDAADLLVTTSAGNIYITVVGYEI